VYVLDITDHGKTSKAILKIFPKQLKHRYINEVNAYRFLYHYEVPDQGAVPKIYGILPSINKKTLTKLLGDSIPEDAPIALPAAAIIMEYIQGAQPASEKNMTHAIAKKALYELQTIHNAHVLHGDAEARNLLVFPETENVVWIDFSSASINRDIMLAMSERRPLKQLLYRKLVLHRPGN
jgi:serine/threonine protein kinase